MSHDSREETWSQTTASLLNSLCSDLQVQQVVACKFYLLLETYRVTGRSFLVSVQEPSEEKTTSWWLLSAKTSQDKQHYNWLFWLHLVFLDVQYLKLMNQEEKCEKLWEGERARGGEEEGELTGAGGGLVAPHFLVQLTNFLVGSRAGSTTLMCLCQLEQN